MRSSEYISRKAIARVTSYLVASPDAVAWCGDVASLLRRRRARRQGQPAGAADGSDEGHLDGGYESWVAAHGQDESCALSGVRVGDDGDGLSARAV